MASAGVRVCTPCTRRSEDTEAAVVCQVCNQNYCKACLESHDRIFGVNNHDMFSVFSEPAQAATDTPDARGLMCPLHPLEVVTLYCFPHNAVFCQVCKSTDHRECIGVEYITQACKGFCRSADTQAQKQKLDATVRRLIDLKAQRSNDHQRLEKEREVMLSSISAFRSDMNKLLDTMEREAIEMIETKFSSMSSKIVADLLHCDRVITSMESLVNTYPISSCENEAYNLFVFDKECPRAVDGGKQAADFLERNVGLETIHFELNTNIEENLRRSSFFKMDKEKPKDGEVSSNKAAAAGIDVDHGGMVEGSSMFVNIAQPTENESMISSICQLSDGWFVLVDRGNSNLKLLNESFELVSVTEIGQWPTKACESGPNEVSVGMEYFSKGAIIQFEPVTRSGVRTLVRLSKMKLKHYCLGLVYHDGMYYMADFSGKVHCYNHQGMFLETVYKVDDFRDMTIGLDQVTLFIIDRYRGVQMVPLTGNSKPRPLATMTSLHKPVAVTPKDMDSVFVCDRKIMNVMVVDKSGIVSKPLLPFDPRRENMKAVFYDLKNNRLIISYNGKCQIEVFILPDTAKSQKIC